MNAQEFTEWAISINGGTMQDKDSIEKTFGSQKAKLKPIEVEYLQWKDNLSEMKMFCKDNCKITYEYAVGIDCYWNLQINDCIKDKLVTVPLHSYVVKLPDGFTVVSSRDFNNYFSNVGSEG